MSTARVIIASVVLLCAPAPSLLNTSYTHHGGRGDSAERRRRDRVGVRPFVERRPNMTKLTMLLSLAAASLGAQAITAAAQDVPTYDVRVTCRAESQGDPGAGAVATCMAD